MRIEDEILVNQYGQGLIEIKKLEDAFNLFDLQEKKAFLKHIIFLIMQSKPIEDDIESSIELSQLKETYTPCVLLAKGVANHNLMKLLELPVNELNKSFILLLSLFKIAYKRRFDIEKNDIHKWWYWDLSDSKKIQTIISLYS